MERTLHDEAVDWDAVVGLLGGHRVRLDFERNIASLAVEEDPDEEDGYVWEYWTADDLQKAGELLIRAAAELRERAS